MYSEEMGIQRGNAVVQWVVCGRSGVRSCAARTSDEYETRQGLQRAERRRMRMLITRVLGGTPPMRSEAELVPVGQVCLSSAQLPRPNCREAKKPKVMSQEP